MSANIQQGFHNSFNTYLDWCRSQKKAGLKTVNWGNWWTAEKESKMDSMLNGEVCQQCGDEMDEFINHGEGCGYPITCPACLESEGE